MWSVLNLLCQHSQSRVEKVCEPLNLITVWPCFGSSDLQQMCPVIVDQTLTTVRRDFAPFAIAIFLWCLVWIALLRSCQSISFGLRSVLWRGRSRRRIFLLLKPIYSCALGHCPVASFSLSWASNGWQTTLHSPTKCLDFFSNILYSQLEVAMLVLYIFLPHILFYFSVICPQNTLPVALRNVQVFYCELVTASCTNRCFSIYLI